jgi:hypothetical protein
MDSRTNSQTAIINDTNSHITPSIISVQQLLTWKIQKAKPIDGLMIPNITIPAHLVSKKRQTEANDTLAINIRMLFNSLTSENLPKVKEQLRSTIVEKAKTPELIEEVAQEILANFIISEQNINNFMHLLNAVSAACVLIPQGINKIDNTRNVSKTIGNFFLQKCKDMIFKLIGNDNIRKLAKMDLDDSDQLDIYNREREKINNLIVTICTLYSQRKTGNLNLTAFQLYDLINTILTSYALLQTKLVELGDPYEGTCTDEEEYELCRKMCSLYGEQLYMFMSKKAKDFSKDQTVVKGQTLAILINKFKNEIVPTLTENFLVSNCESIEY